VSLPARRQVPDLDDLLCRGYRFALSLTHDPTQAEDLVQEGWLGVLRAKGPFTRAYLFKAIRNRFIDNYRRSKLVTTESLEDQPEIEMESETRFWSRQHVLVPLNGVLERALGQLKPRERAVIFLTAVEGWTAAEIAELLGCPRGTVLSMMYRSRLKLRQWLDPEDGGSQ